MNTKKVEVVAILISVITLVIGVYLGTICPDYFSRTGSLIVVYGVLCAAFGIRSNTADAAAILVYNLMLKKDEVSTKIRKNLNENIKNDHPEIEVSDSYLSGLVKKIEADAMSFMLDEGRRQLGEALKPIRKFSLWTELILIVTGTIVWGFGDLFYKII